MSDVLALLFGGVLVHNLVLVHLCGVERVAAIAPRPLHAVLALGLFATLAAALVAHNHPSGEPTPSEQDRELTYRMAQVGHLLGIVLLDHVVVARGGHYSFAEHGHLESPLTLPAPRPEPGRSSRPPPSP